MAIAPHALSVLRTWLGIQVNRKEMHDIRNAVLGYQSLTAQSNDDVSEAEALEELYAGDPAEFVASRNRLSKALRTSGDRDAAGRLAVLRRPTKIAAILNRMARSNGDTVANIIARAKEVRTSQLALLQGGAPDDFKRSQAEFRSALDGLRSGPLAELNELERTEVIAEIEQRAFNEEDLGQLFSGHLSSPDDVPARSPIDAFTEVVPVSDTSVASRKDREQAERIALEEQERLDAAVRDAETSVERASINYERAKRALADAQSNLDDAWAARRRGS